MITLVTKNMFLIISWQHPWVYTKRKICIKSTCMLNMPSSNHFLDYPKDCVNLYELYEIEGLRQEKFAKKDSCRMKLSYR